MSVFPKPAVPGPSAATPQARIAQGYALLRQGRTADAVGLGEELAAAYPGDPHVLVLAAEACLANAAPQAALEWTDKAIAASGGDPFLKVKKARLLGQMRRGAEVPELAAEVSAIAEGNGPLLWQLGTLYYRNNRQADAIAHFEKARALLGERPGLLYELAVARFFSGDFERAEQDIERMLALVPQAGPALYLRATLRRQTPERNHVEDLRRRLGAGTMKPEDEAAAWYALAKELEDLGEHAESFDALAEGASRKRATLTYDVGNECASMQKICEAYTAEAIAAPSPGCDEEGAIFIVGMPRSGTTLVERMLVQSGKVKAAGELMDFGNLLGIATQKVIDAQPARTQAEASLGIDFAALGRDYLCGARQHADGNALFIDKMPVNFLYCGMIAKALPAAKIIHLVRDPLDSCYAVFKTLFFNSYSFSYDQLELAEYYIAYRRMMSHWHQVMPGRILDVRYEDLVADVAGQTRRIYEWCGLDWSPEVMAASTERAVFATASAAQVREPVHNRSVNSSRRHLDRLAPLAERLAAAGLGADAQ